MNVHEKKLAAALFDAFERLSPELQERISENPGTHITVEGPNVIAEANGVVYAVISRQWLDSDDLTLPVLETISTDDLDEL